VAWVLPFLLANRRKGAKAVAIDRRARWGVLLQGLSYAVLMTGRFWLRQPNPWRVALALIFLVLGATLSWSGVRALGRQWRVDAGLNAEHDLVREGPYRFVRHPIYSSMLCVFLAVGLLMAPWPLFACAALLFLIGTEIRVRIEEKLLASRFGDQFARYRSAVSAYVPFAR
jgi:protein-S-isoprenylcysteine O-methyltransferase Ste14